MGRLGMDWSGSGLGQVSAGACECSNQLSASYNVGNFLTTWGRPSFSRKTLLNGVSYTWFSSQSHTNNWCKLNLPYFNIYSFVKLMAWWWTIWPIRAVILNETLLLVKPNKRVMTVIIPTKLQTRCNRMQVTGLTKAGYKQLQRTNNVGISTATSENCYH